MAATRTFAVPSSLILAAIGISVAASAVLIAFPGNLRVWQVGAWTLVAALLALLVLVLASAYVLVTDRAARTWQRIASSLLGLACLAIIAVGAL